MALLSGGGNAEYVSVPASHLVPVPQGMDLDRAAAIPEVSFLTFGQFDKFCNGYTAEWGQIWAYYLLLLFFFGT